MLVSVTIPVYNGAAFVAQAIDSALAQDHTPLEVIVGDDGSTDDTASVLASYGDRIRVVRHPGNANRGLGATRNLMIRAARGELIALLDHDDLWLPGKLAAQVRALAQQPDAAMCHTAYERFGDPAEAGPVIADPTFVFEGRCFEKIFRVNGVCVPTVLLRRSALPPQLFYEDLAGCEDYALWIELMFDHPVVYLRDILARYRRHPQQMTGQDRLQRSMAYRGLARLRFLERHSHRLPPPQRDELRRWTLEELRACVYSRYWKGDYDMAIRGFGWMRQYGQAPPLRHRLRARIGAMLQR